MDHVNLKREEFIVDVVLRRRVHVELDKAVVDSGIAGGAVDDNFNGRSEILEDHWASGDVEGRSGRCRGDGGIWWKLSVGISLAELGG